jgi:hypothetical protein
MYSRFWEVRFSPSCKKQIAIVSVSQHLGRIGTRSAPSGNEASCDGSDCHHPHRPAEREWVARTDIVEKSSQ